jgi:SAM-dependent methyltransferase
MMANAETPPPTRQQRERAFWDRYIHQTAATQPNVESREVPPQVGASPAYQFFLRALGDLQGKRVLECGCGDGRISVLLASAGALVQALDISPASVELCRRRAAAWEVSGSLSAAVADLENLPYADQAFDVVCGVFVLHHVNTIAAGREIARVLRSGGRAVFLENSAANPVLRLGRKYLVGRCNIPRLGSPDEKPLSASEIQNLRRFFGQVGCHYPQMLFFELASQRFVQAVFPLARFPRGIPRLLGNWLWEIGPLLDRALYRLAPFLRRYSWWQILLLSKPTPFPGTL